MPAAAVTHSKAEFIHAIGLRSLSGTAIHTVADNVACNQLEAALEDNSVAA